MNLILKTLNYQCPICGILKLNVRYLASPKRTEISRTKLIRHNSGCYWCEICKSTMDVDFEMKDFDSNGQFNKLYYQLCTCYNIIMTKEIQEKYINYLLTK